MSVHDTKIQDFTNVLKQFYAKVKALIPTKVSQLTNDSGYKTTDTTYTNFVKSGSGAKAGLVPAPPTTAGTSKYLREDGTWQATPAAVTPVNNLLATTAGSPLDAVQGKVLNDKIDGVNSSLGGLKFGTDGDGNYGYYGADGSLVPFKAFKTATKSMNFNVSSGYFGSCSLNFSDVFKEKILGIADFYITSSVGEVGAFRDSHAFIINGKTVRFTAYGGNAGYNTNVNGTLKVTAIGY